MQLIHYTCIFSDVQANLDEETTLTETQIAQNTGFTLCSIDMTNAVDMAFHLFRFNVTVRLLLIGHIVTTLLFISLSSRLSQPSSSRHEYCNFTCLSPDNARLPRSMS